MAIDFKQPGSADPDVLIDINTTPLIDVMLVLLIMLIITIPMQTHAVKLDMPVGTPPPATVVPEVVSIDVDFDGTVLWNGHAVASRAALEQQLLAAAAEAVQPELHLRANKLVSYKYVAAVLASAQRLGLNKTGLIGNEKFLDEGDQ
jgi:biopolymer transport protein ExbD